MWGMTELTVAAARARLADVVDEVRERHRPVFLTRRGRRVAAVIDAEDLDRLLGAAEDLADIEAARAARAEVSAQGSIPWDRVKADLGLIGHRIALGPAAARRLRARRAGPAPHHTPRYRPPSSRSGAVPWTSPRAKQAAHSG